MLWRLRPGVLSRAAVGAAGNLLAITGTPVTTATVGVVYAGFTVIATGGTPPYTYSVASGSLPAGITLNAGSGAVTGTPTVLGTYASIVLRATDAVSATANLAAFTITVGTSVTSAAVLDGAFVDPRGSATLIGTEVIDSGPATVFDP